MNRGANPCAIDMSSSRKLWNWSIPSVLAVRPLWQSFYRSELYSSRESVTVVFIIRLFAIYSQSRAMLLFGSFLLAAELGTKIVSFATCKAKIKYLTLPFSSISGRSRMERGSIFLMVSQDDTYQSCLLTDFPQVSWAVYSSEKHPRQFGFSYCWISRDDLPHSPLQPVCV